MGYKMSDKMGVKLREICNVSFSISLSNPF